MHDLGNIFFKQNLEFSTAPAPSDSHPFLPGWVVESVWMKGNCVSDGVITWRNAAGARREQPFTVVPSSQQRNTVV